MSLAREAEHRSKKQREKELSISNNLKDLTDRIGHALERIDAGTYGLCERCGRPIEKARLKALPYASLCLADKQAEERVRDRRPLARRD